MPYPQAMLIDLDDTILDTTLSADRVWFQTAEAFAHELGMPAAEIEAALAPSRQWYWADPERNRLGRLNLYQARIDVTLHGLQRIGLDDPDLARRFADHYSENRVTAMTPFPGAIEALDTFRAAGVRLALLSNGKGATQREKVEHFGLSRRFEIVLIEGEIGYGKPNPRVYARALEACRVRARDAWCIGDNLLWEVQAPQALGLQGIWHDWAETGLPADSRVRPDRIIHRLTDLIEPSSS